MSNILRIFQTVAVKLVCIGVIAIGVALVLYPSSQVYHAVALRFPDSSVVRMALAAVVIALGICCVLPSTLFCRTGKTLTFTGRHGSGTIKLGPIEQRLTRDILRQPDVKKITIRLHPSEDRRQARLSARMILRKAAGVSTQEIYSRLESYIAARAQEILGPAEVLSVDLDVEDILVEAVQGPVAADAPAARPPVPVEATPVYDPREPEMREMPRETEEPAWAPAEPAEEEEEQADVLPGEPLPETEDEAPERDEDPEERDRREKGKGRLDIDEQPELR